MENLALEVFDRLGNGSKFATLPDDASITINDTSEIFASGDVWSHDFTLNVHANMHIFGTSGDMHGGRLHEQINKRKARLWVLGTPLYVGYINLGSDAEIDNEGNVDVSFQSGQKTFDDMVEGAKANQVPMMNDIQIGMALWRNRWTYFGLRIFIFGITKGGTISGEAEKTVIFDNEGEDTPVQSYPRMVYPKGTFNYADKEGDEVKVDCLNTDTPYTEDDNGNPTHPYCNIALCYQKYSYEKTDENGIKGAYYNDEPEAQRDYEYMPANRVNSAPNFFVIYWIRCLMKHLGIHVDENQMMDVEDLRRLFFVNTNCAYKEPEKIRTVPTDNYYGKYKFKDGRLVAELPDRLKTVSLQDSEIQAVNTAIGFPTYNTYNGNYLNELQVPVTDHIEISIKDILPPNVELEGLYHHNNSYLHKAFATSECFPNTSISDTIKALESGFGIRFLFDRNYQRVRIVLLRNIFRSSDVQEIECDIVSNAKKENGIRGFRMTYGDSEDTTFYYKGFADMLPHIKTLWPNTSDKHDYSHWSLNEEYSNILNKVTALNKTCYVTPVTGNAYGVKVDKDAKGYKDLHPALFEFAGYMDAEDGDCSGEEDTIETVNVGFKPAIMNDLNMEEERAGNTHEQRFALFVDEKMQVRRVDLNTGKNYNDPDAYYDVNMLYYDFLKFGSTFMNDEGVVMPGNFSITSDTLASQKNIKATLKKDIEDISGNIFTVKTDVGFDIEGHVSEGYRIYLQDNFAPNDDGVCPIETHDWGLTLGIMRGSGNDAKVEYTTDPDDNVNDTWDIVPGSNATSHPDICDNYGNEWDYEPGTEDQTTEVVTQQDAKSELEKQFPNSNAPFYTVEKGYINKVALGTTYTYNDMENGRLHKTLFAVSYSKTGATYSSVVLAQYNYYLLSHFTTYSQILAYDRSSSGKQLIIEIDSSEERGNTLIELCKKAYGEENSASILIDHGIGSRYGRFSLKLRAEKPNPYYDPTQEETHYDPDHPELNTNPRYLHIDNEHLQGRGLCDQFYKEYSFWVRNARIASLQVRMELAQLLSIDKTKRVKVGDITGFIRKMQYSVSKKTGLGMVTMEIMYI